MAVAILSPTDYDVKSTLTGNFNISEAEGIVECFVAAIGNKDHVGDVIVPGAFKKTLQRRKPRVVWGHDWNHPIGKVLEVYEVGPNDPRLPTKMRQAGVGGLYAKVQFNLRSEKGKEAFENIVFFGGDQEWSIGYKTRDAEYDGRLQANMLKEVELFEMSPVLHGANSLTATISVKSGEQDDTEDDGLIVRGIAMLKSYADENPDWAESVLDGTVESEVKRDFSADQRSEMADEGLAMPDGSYPIANRTDLANAIQAIGRAGDPEAVKRHIRKRAAALNALDMIPESWGAEEKVGPGNVDAIQDAIGGDVLRGRGPRRGNMEDLLDYWRPIMKKPGGFRRCLVILADHPELGPLPNLCAWLHHETTGKWPGEGHRGGKSLDDMEVNVNPFRGNAAELAKSLVDRFGGVVTILKADSSSVIYEINNGETTKTQSVKYQHDEDDFLFGKPKDYTEEPDACSCGGKCGGSKSLEEDLDDIEEKVGRVLNSTNSEKIRQALALLREVLTSGGLEVEVKNPTLHVKSGEIGLASALTVVNQYYGVESGFEDGSSMDVSVKSAKHLTAVENVLMAFSAEWDSKEIEGETS